MGKKRTLLLASIVGLILGSLASACRDVTVTSSFDRALAKSTLSPSPVAGLDKTPPVITVAGSGFGFKNNPTPVYWSNMEEEIAGATPIGWTKPYAPDGGMVSSDDMWTGAQSLKFTMNTAGHNWQSLLKDMGVASPEWYFHFKVRLNNYDANTRFQWKSWRISSSPDGYAWNFANTTSVLLNDWWWDESTGWFNTSTYAIYNNGGTPASTGCSFISSSSILFGQWQTLEEYVRMSSVPLATDGIIQAWRDSMPILNMLNTVTHDADSGQWRYLQLGMAIANQLPIDGSSNMEVYYDDIYLDNTQARVMIGNSPVFSGCTQREIQIATSWTDNQVSFLLNRGRFNSGDTGYIFVIDSNGTPHYAGSINF